MLKTYFHRLFLKRCSAFKSTKNIQECLFPDTSSGYLSSKNTQKAIYIPVVDFKENILIETGKYFRGDPYVFDISPRPGVFHEVYVWERACVRAV